MLRRIFNVNPTLPIRCSRGITKRLVLGLSTRARHVAGDVPLPCPAQWFSMPELPGQPRIVLQCININMSSQVPRLPLADDMPFSWPDPSCYWKQTY